jgi:hypothetical protein
MALRAATTADPRQMAEALDAPETEALTTEALSWPDRARALVVTDAGSYVAAGQLLLGIKALSQKADATFDPNIKLWNDGHKAALSMKAEIKAPLIEAEKIIKAGLVSYDQEQQRKQREAQRLADEQARAERERAALEHAAALELEGALYGDTGMLAEATQIIEETIQAPAPPVALVPKETPKVAGIAMRTDWTAVCDDLAALVKFIAIHPEHANLVQFNQTAGNQLARSQRERMKIPGLRAVPTQRVAAGR